MHDFSYYRLGELFVVIWEITVIDQKFWTWLIWGSLVQSVHTRLTESTVIECIVFVVCWCIHCWLFQVQWICPVFMPARCRQYSAAGVSCSRHVACCNLYSGHFFVIVCGFYFFYKTYQPAQYIPDCVNFPFSALTLLVGWQEGHPACNKTEWWGADVCVRACVRVIVLLPSVLWCCWLGGRKGIWPVKNWVVGCWHGYLSEARCRLAYGPADAIATHCLLLQ